MCDVEDKGYGGLGGDHDDEEDDLYSSANDLSTAGDADLEQE